MYLIDRFERWAGRYLGDFVVENQDNIKEDSKTSNYSILPLSYNCAKYSGCADDYAAYMREFWFRHPIMYLLFYRWWIIRALPKKGLSYSLIMWHGLNDPSNDVAALAELKHFTAEPPPLCKTNLALWARFALYHPIIVFLWIIFRTLCKLMEEFLSAFIKPVKSVRHLLIGSIKRMFRQCFL